MSSERRGTLIALSLSAILIIGLAVVRLLSRDFQREIEPEERVTLQNYTWAGLNQDGTRRDLRRLEDIKQLPDPSLRQLAMGAYCSFGRWMDPENHVPHSFLVNLTLPFFQPKTVAMRLPALLCAALFALALAHLCCLTRACRAAPLVAVVSFSHPYVVRFSQTSTGHALMLLLVVLFVTLLLKVAEKPDSLLRGVGMVVVSILSFQNIVNLALVWVIPIYLVGLVWPAWFLTREAPVEHRRAFRRNLLIQSVGFCAVGFVFFMDRMPAVFFSFRQVGVPIDSFPEVGVWATQVGRSLFPQWSTWILLGAGLPGMVWACRHREARQALLPFVISFFATALLFLTIRRGSDFRQLGYLLPFVFLSFGYGCQCAFALEHRFAKAVLLLLALCVCGSVAWTSHQPSIRDPNLRALAKFLYDLKTRPRGVEIPIQGRNVPSSLELYYPVDWKRITQPPAPGAQVHLKIIEKQDAPFEIHSPDRKTKWMPMEWSDAGQEHKVADYSIYSLPARAGRLTDEGLFQLKVIVLWYPAESAVAVSSKPILQFLDEHQLAYLTFREQYQVSLNVYDRLGCVMIVPGENVVQFQKSIRQTMEKFGGQMILLHPEK